MANSDQKSNTLIFRCPGCNAKMSARRESVGKTFTCPRCKATITVCDPVASNKSSTKDADSQNASKPKPAADSGHAPQPSQNASEPRPAATLDDFPPSFFESDKKDPAGKAAEDFDDFDDFQPSPDPASSGAKPRPSDAGIKPESSRTSLLAGLRRISFRPNWSIPNVKLPNYLVRGRGSSLEQVAERFAAAIDGQKGNTVQLAFASESQNIPQHDRPFRIVNSVKLGHNNSTDVSFKCQGADLYVEFNAKCRTLNVYLKRLLYSLMFCSLFIGLSAAYLAYTGAFDSWLKDSALKDAQITDKVAEFLVRKQQAGYKVFTAATFAEKFQELKQASLVKELQAQIDRDTNLLRESIPKIHSLVDELQAKASSLHTQESELQKKAGVMVSEISAMHNIARLEGGYGAPGRGGDGASSLSDSSAIVSAMDSLHEKQALLKKEKKDRVRPYDNYAYRNWVSRGHEITKQIDNIDDLLPRLEQLAVEVKQFEKRRESCIDDINETVLTEYPILGLHSEYTRPESGFKLWLLGRNDFNINLLNSFLAETGNAQDTRQWPLKLMQGNIRKEEWAQHVGPTRAKLADLYLIVGAAEGRLETDKWLLNLNGHDLLLRLALSMQSLNANNSFQYRQNEYSVDFVPGFVAPYSQGYGDHETPRDFNTRIDKIEFLDNVEFSSYLLENFRPSQTPPAPEAVLYGDALGEPTRLEMVRVINEAIQHSLTQVPPASLAGLIKRDPKLFFLNNSTAFAVIGAILGAFLWLLPTTWIDPFCRILRWPTFDEFKKSTLAHNAWVERVLSDTLLHDFGVQEGDKFTVHAN